MIFSMRKVVLCLFYALCAFAIAFSLFWMALPRLALPSLHRERTAPPERRCPPGRALRPRLCPTPASPPNTCSGTRAAWWPSTPAGRTAPHPPCPADGYLRQPPARKRLAACQTGHDSDGRCRPAGGAGGPGRVSFAKCQRPPTSGGCRRRRLGVPSPHKTTPCAMVWHRGLFCGSVSAGVHFTPR